MELNLKFKHSAGGLKTPKFEDGHINIYASEEAIISPSNGKFIKTNTSFEVPKGYALLITPSPALSSRTALRYGCSVVVVTEKDTGDVVIPVENTIPRPVSKEVVPGFFLLTGEYKDDYSKGYLPINSVVVQKGDCIGKGYLIKLETASISRIEKKKVQEKENETNE